METNIQELDQLKEEAKKFVSQLNKSFDYKWIPTVYKSLFPDNYQSILCDFLDKATFKSKYIQELETQNPIDTSKSLSWIKKNLKDLENEILSTQKKDDLKTVLLNNSFEIKEFNGNTFINIKNKHSKLLNACLATIQSRVKIQNNQNDSNKVEERIFIIEFTLQDGQKISLELSHSSLLSGRSLNDVLLKHKIQFYSESYLPQLREYLIDHFNYETIIELNKYGYINGIGWVFADGIYGKSGFISINKERTLSLNEKTYFIPEKLGGFSPPFFNIDKDIDSFTDFINEWMTINSPMNVASILAYAIAIMLRPEFFERKRFFPLLFFNGIASTGKTTNAEYLFHLLGFSTIKKQSLGGQATDKFIYREITKYQSLPFFIDDYRNPKTDKSASFTNMLLLNAFNAVGGGMARKTIDNTTFEMPIICSLVITGNELPTDEAILSRLFILDFNKILGSNPKSKANDLFNKKETLNGFWKLIYPNLIQQKESLFTFHEYYVSELSKHNFYGRQADIYAIILSCYKILDHLLFNINYSFEEFRSDIIQSKADNTDEKEVLSTTFLAITMKYHLQLYSESYYNSIDVNNVKAIIIEESKKCLAIVFDDVWDVLSSKPNYPFKKVAKIELHRLLLNHPAFIEKSKTVRFNDRTRRAMIFSFSWIENNANINVTA